MNDNVAFPYHLCDCISVRETGTNVHNVVAAGIPAAYVYDVTVSFLKQSIDQSQPDESVAADDNNALRTHAKSLNKYCLTNRTRPGFCTSAKENDGSASCMSRSALRSAARYGLYRRLSPMETG